MSLLWKSHEKAMKGSWLGRMSGHQEIIYIFIYDKISFAGSVLLQNHETVKMRGLNIGQLSFNIHLTEVMMQKL